MLDEIINLDFGDEFQPHFDNTTGDFIILYNFYIERKLIGPKLLLLLQWF